MGFHLHRSETPDGPRRALTYGLAAGPGAPALARHAVSFYLRRRLERMELAEALLATSELVTNAVKYGGQHIWLHVLVSDDELAITVTNETSRATPGFCPVPTTDDGTALSEGGRGLGIVSRVSDEVTVFCDDVVIVRAARRLGRDAHAVDPAEHAAPAIFLGRVRRAA